MAWKEIRAEELQLNPFTKIGKEWMLITAGDRESYNTMTAAWGGVGYLWNKNVATVYVRPQRYTREFLDQTDLFTLSFLGSGYRKELTLLGRKSGRDCDKIQEAGLTPRPVEQTMAFEEAEMVLLCRKLYHQQMSGDGFDDLEAAEACYPEKDYHIMYVAEILKVLVK